MLANEKRDLLYDSMLLEIERISCDETQRLLGEEDNESQVPRHEKSHAVLRQLITSSEGVQAFKNEIAIACYFALSHWLDVLDGTVYPANEVWSVLIDGETREDLTPEGDTYVAEFSEYLGLSDTMCWLAVE